MSEVATKYRAPALERGLDIIELLASQDEPLSKKEIAEKLDRSINELFRMLTILSARGYLQVDETGRFGLSLKTFELSNQHPPVERLLQAANEQMMALAAASFQSCHLSVLQGREMLVIAKQDSPYKMGFSLRLSARIDIHGSGSGVTMLAYLPEEKRILLLDQLDVTPLERNTILQQVKSVLESGYFIGESPQVLGVTNITYPVFNARSIVEAVITVPFLTLNSDSLHHQVTSFEDTRIETARTAKQLTQAIGGRFPSDYPHDLAWDGLD
ncbi:IclR family transcriptional regulator [Polycladidibacter hongkongensis]|uniref:IclR family transcriptional regulator n=1 Tax=Polycladidibacter hongkongensis TaxID=1647556 RepID=UPI00082F15DA|nr:IclR family transcriptional regulator [Pseudovibrio hongkongensis]